MIRISLINIWLFSHLFVPLQSVMKKILFLHGFYASGQCIPAMALRDAFEGRAEVITPDLPIHPKEAVRFISELIEAEKPDLLIGIR